MIKLLQILLLVGVSAGIAQAQVVLWQENFDAAAALPAGWSQTTLATDGGWKVGATTALQSQFFPISSRPGNIVATNDDNCNCDKSNDLLKFPVLNFSTAVEPYLLFDLYYAGATYQGSTEELYLLSSENGTDWTIVEKIDGNGSWENNRGVSLASLAGKSTVYLAFRYVDDAGWMFGAGFDNLRIVEKDNILRTTLDGAQVVRTIDLIPRSVAYDKFFVDGEVFVGGQISNPSFAAITSFDATWSNGVDTKTQTYSGLNVGLGESYYFEMTDGFLVKEGANDVTLTITNVNGVGDNDATDNVGTSGIIGVKPVEGRKVIIEEGTGTWCGWCPRGAVMLKHMEQFYEETAIGIAVHNADPMVVSTYDTGMGTLITGYPSGLVDRVHNNIDPTEFEAYYVERMAIEPTVLVSQEVDWDEATRKATVHSKLKFLEETNGNYRIAVVYIEDDVKGTGSTFGQVNYYAGGVVGPMNGYENLPATVPAAQMVYEHVARGIVGGFTGAANSVPTSNPAGSEHEYTSTFTILNSFNVEKMHAVTMLLSGNNRVVNAEKTTIPFTSVSSNEPQSELISVSMFPNPVSESATITLNLLESADVQVRIIDALGRTAVERNYTGVQGEHFLPFQVDNLANGTYMLTVSANGQMVTKPFVIVR